MDFVASSTSFAPARWEADAVRIGTAIKRRRIALDLSQAELANEAGIARADYELVETGDWPAKTTLASIAHLLAAVLRALEPASDGAHVGPPLAA